MTYTLYADLAARGRALGLARGRYQRELLEGTRRWSGADIPADKFGLERRAERSRGLLLSRLDRAGLYRYPMVGARGCKVVLIASWPTALAHRREVETEHRAAARAQRRGFGDDAPADAAVVDAAVLAELGLLVGRAAR